jgi:prepilin-type processing-associated H-X9-DG protein
VGPDGLPGRPLAGQFWSALALTLPYIEQQNLYNMINFSFSAYGIDPFNRTAMLARVNLFVCPSDLNRLTNDEGHTNYAANFGTVPISFFPHSDGVFGPVPEASTVGHEDITDGTSNTAAFSEIVNGAGRRNDEARDTLQPSASVFDVPGQDPFRDPAPYRQACKAIDPRTAPLRTNFGRGALWYSGHPWGCHYNHVMLPNDRSCAYTCDPTATRGGTHWCGALTAGSRHPGMVNVLMADGGVRAIKDTIAIDVWRVLGTRAGGEVIGADAY